MSPQYIADAISGRAIGARTNESQIHRQFAFGVWMTIGLKDATDGDVQVAVAGELATAVRNCRSPRLNRTDEAISANTVLRSSL